MGRLQAPPLASCSRRWGLSEREMLKAQRMSCLMIHCREEMKRKRSCLTLCTAFSCRPRRPCAGETSSLAPRPFMSSCSGQGQETRSHMPLRIPPEEANAAFWRATLGKLGMPDRRLSRQAGHGLTHSDDADRKLT